MSDSNEFLGRYPASLRAGSFNEFLGRYPASLRAGSFIVFCAQAKERDDNDQL